MIHRTLVLALGAGQMISWGITYYLIGALGPSMQMELAWKPALLQGGFSCALLTMGLCSPLIGSLSDRHGGRIVMCAGSILNAAGALLLALSHHPAVYYAGWLILGLGMRCTLYDAAFAALARIMAGNARRAMAQITLPGGLSATLFWPLGQWLCTQLGWRGALLVYALLALCTLPLHATLPSRRHWAGTDNHAGSATVSGARPAVPSPQPPLARTYRQLWLAGMLFALLTTLANFINAGMSAHMISLLTALGIGSALAVWIAALRGLGQSAARMMEVLCGRTIDPLALNLGACLLLPLSFAIALGGDASTIAAVAFVLLYGAGNGLLTITRGTLPLALFDHRSYGGLVGKLVAPGFLLSAAAPVLYAWSMEYGGPLAGLWLSALCALAILATAGALWWMFRPQVR